MTHPADYDARSSTQERWTPCPIHASQNTNSQPCRECRLACEDADESPIPPGEDDEKRSQAASDEPTAENDATRAGLTEYLNDPLVEWVHVDELRDLLARTRNIPPGEDQAT